jgi:hypothetical protein
MGLAQKELVRRDLLALVGSSAAQQANPRATGQTNERFQSVPRAPFIFDGNRVDAIDPAHDAQENKFRMSCGGLQRFRESLGIGKVNHTPMEIDHALILCRLVGLGHRSVQYFTFERRKLTSLS